MSRQRSPSGAHHNYWRDVPDNHEGKMSSTRETQRPWKHTDNIQRKKHTYVEEQSEYVPSRRAPDKLFPLKPVLHKRAYSLSNVTKPEHDPSLSTLSHQAAIRHQQKVVRKLDALNQHFTGRKINDEHHEQKISEKQSWLSREIQSKEMMLQQKIFKAEETMRRVRNKSYYEKQKEDRLYSNGYADWDEEMDRCGKRQDRWEREEKVSRQNAKWDARGRALTPEYEYTAAKDYDWEKRNERGMRSDNHLRRRREVQLDREDDDMRKPNSSDSMRRDRPHLKAERREDRDGLYELTSRLMSMKYADRNPSQRGSRLQQVEMEESLDAGHGLIPCKVCHRSFARERLETHMKVCENKRPQRKVFDMSRYRAKGTELEEFMKTNGRSKTPEHKKSTWRQKHEAFIQTMRQGRSHTSGGDQPQPAINLHPEYVSCPHCGRRFAPGPAERHVPKCQNIKSRPPPPKQTHHSSRSTVTH